MTAPPLVSPRSVFDPQVGPARPDDPHVGPARPDDPHVRPARPDTAPVAGSVRAWRVSLLAYYRDPLSWLVLPVSALLLCYGGGAAMFWFHAVELGEGGPAISWQAHWLLDSTVGFIALTPALLLIIPIAVLVADTYFSARPRLHPLVYGGVTGGLFALLTVPGPIAHDQFVGRGTWLAARVTEVIGDPAAPLGPHHEYPFLAAVTQQFGFAVPLYVILAVISVPLIRALTTARRAKWTLREERVTAE